MFMEVVYFLIMFVYKYIYIWVWYVLGNDVFFIKFNI